MVTQKMALSGPEAGLERGKLPNEPMCMLNGCVTFELHNLWAPSRDSRTQEGQKGHLHLHRAI